MAETYFLFHNLQCTSHLDIRISSMKILIDFELLYVHQIHQMKSSLLVVGAVLLIVTTSQARPNTEDSVVAETSTESSSTTQSPSTSTTNSFAAEILKAAGKRILLTFHFSIL